MAPRREDRAWSVYVTPGSMTPVEHWQINLGAPGDRKDSGGRVWFGYPRLGIGYGVRFALRETIQPELGFFARSHEGLPIRGTGRPWLFASGVRGHYRAEIPLLGDGQEPASYTVRLGFCELDCDRPGERLFDIKLQGELVAEDFDIFREAGRRYAAVVKEFRHVEVKDSLLLELISEIEAPGAARAPLLNSIEILRERG
jgi:hypothetical protein